MARIFLIGFMCSGKSTVGRVLAPMLGLSFVDLDRVVEERVGPLLTFVQREGEEAFRAREREVLAELMDGPDSVIATGGGTPCEGDNLALMKEAGTVVWLDVPLEMLMLRIVRAGGDRPLLFGLKGDALRERVLELLEARTPIYAQADIIVQAGVPPMESAGRIRRVLDQVR
ncbi:MAG: shikimate kinase [Flavobacteriales bacterium]|nr:shikimate kinase [Flavobacteriales bacterium]